jgi:alcohol dehydrogenase class IV
MNPFTYDQLPARIVFGAGRLADVGAEVERLGGRRVMLISDWAAEAPAAAVTAQLGSRLALGWTEVAQHVPVELADRARAAATGASIDCVVCIGGGSSTGLAKAIALRTDSRTDHVRGQVNRRPSTASPAVVTSRPARTRSCNRGPLSTTPSSPSAFLQT